MNINNSAKSPTTSRLGFWAAAGSALAVVVYVVCFIAIAVTRPLFIWSDLAGYVSYAQTHGTLLPDLARLAMLIFAVLFVLVLNSIHDQAPANRKILTRSSLCFGLAFAVLTGAHYFTQISAVRLNVLTNQLVGLEQVIQANPYSAFSAMNMAGWTLFLGLSSLLVAPVFSGRGLARVLRIAFFLNGIFCLAGGVGYVLGLVVLVFVAINLGMGAAITVIPIALALWFRRLEQSTPASDPL